MTRIAYVPVLAVVLSSAVAQDRPEDQVKAAISAAGGAEVLAKYPAGRVVGKGTMTFGGAENAFTVEQAYQIPDKLRTVVRCEVKGRNWELLQVVNGETLRQTINGQRVPVTDAGAKELNLALLLNEVSQLTPLTTGKKFAIKAEKQTKGPDAGTVLVHVRGQPELRLAFDRKTGHLARLSYKATDPDTAKEADTETTFADYKDFSGLSRPTRSVVTRDGKKVVDLVVEKFTPLEKIDPKAFTLDE